MKYLRNIIGSGTIVVSVAAVRYSLCFLILGALLLGILVVVIVSAAAFSKRSAPMARLRALVRDIRGEERPALPLRLSDEGDPSHLQAANDHAVVARNPRSRRVRGGAHAIIANDEHGQLGAGRRGR